MNRTEALAIIKNINVSRSSVNKDFDGVGFFFGDAVKALGDFDRASRHLASLIKVGAVRCTTIQLGATSHDFYTVV